MVVNNAEVTLEALVFLGVLQADPVLHCAQVVAEMDVASRLNSRHYGFAQEFGVLDGCH